MANTANDRIECARAELTPTQVATGLLFIVALSFTLLFVQDPLAHDSLYNSRHAAGIAYY